MASVNKCILVGNLTRDPELKTFTSGDQIANISLATNERWRDKNTGENKEAVEFHRVVFRDKLASTVGQYMRKGSSMYLEGVLKTRKWTDKEGQERYQTEIHAHTMQMLGGKSEGQAPEPAPRQAPQPQRQASVQRTSSGFDDVDSDIPW